MIVVAWAGGIGKTERHLRSMHYIVNRNHRDEVAKFHLQSLLYQEGKLQAVDLGKGYRIYRSELDRFIKERLTKKDKDD